MGLRGRPRKQPAEIIEDEKPQPQPQQTWAFPSRSRCPRCGSIQTKAYRVEGGVQYRECQNAVCRRRYRVDGILV